MKRNVPYEAWNTKNAKILKYHFFIPTLMSFYYFYDVPSHHTPTAGGIEKI